MTPVCRIRNQTSSGGEKVNGVFGPNKNKLYALYNYESTKEITSRVSLFSLVVVHYAWTANFPLQSELER